MKYVDSFQPGVYYHLFNHAIGNELLFRHEENYYFFLNKFSHYMLPIAATYAYCLMPNHFHFLIQFRNEEVILDYARSKIDNKEFPEKAGFDFHKFLMQQFSNFLNSYTKALNKTYGRKGALFLDYTRRAAINDVTYLKNLVVYIHNNPVKHGFCLYPDEWKFSSYSSMLNLAKSSKIERYQLLEWFSEEESIPASHLKKGIYVPEDYLIE